MSEEEEAPGEGAAAAPEAFAEAARGVLSAPGSGPHTGAVVKINGSFGFIGQDSGEADMFVMPAGCMAFGGQIPPVGTRVCYFVVQDEKTGRPRADSVEPLDAGLGAEWAPQGAPSARAPPAAPLRAGGTSAAWPRPGAWAGAPPRPSRGAWPQRGALHGSILKIAGAFGFIQQDSGEADMFVMPAACAAFGSAIPPVGTRVCYTVVVDAKTGRPRAEGVEPEPGDWYGPCAAYGPALAGKGACGRWRPYGGWPAGAGSWSVGGWTPGGWPAGTPALPAPGGWAGGRRGASAGPAGGRAAGAMAKDHGSFGFISLDAGGPDMFVMPAACAAFGGVLPPLHARLEFDVVIDAKTGRPRAENVVPLDP